MGKIRQLIRSLLNINITNYGKRQQILLFCCLLCLFLILNIGSLFFPLKESLTYDEASKFESGLAILSSQPSERGATEINKRNIVPVSALNVLISKPIPKSIISKLTENEEAITYNGKIYPDGRIYFGKLATIVASLILAIYVFCWARQLYGVNAAFLALCLYILDPNIIAHSRLVTQDIFSACSIFIATYYFWNFLKFGGQKNAVLSIITFGIAQITRYTSIYLLPIYFVLTICFYGSTILNLIQTRNFKRILSSIKNFCLYTTLLLLTTIIIINISFSFEKTLTKLGNYKFESQTFSSLQSSSPLLKELTIPVPYAYFRGLDFGKYKQETGFGSGPSYLMGRLGIDNNNRLKGFKEYYIVAFLYKVPIATQLLILMAVTSLIRYRHRINFWHNEAFLIIPSLFFPIAFSFSSTQLGIRYILMIFPFLFVLSSRVVIGWNALTNKYRIFVTGLVTYLLISNFSYFPHYLSYFNELLVDRKIGYTIIADSNLDWGQNKNYLKDYLTKNPETMYAPPWFFFSLRNNPKLTTINANDLLGITNDTKIFDPDRPQAGSIIIAANDLVGATTQIKSYPKSYPKSYQWIKENLKPVDHVGYSYLVFKLQPEDLPQILVGREKM